MEKTSTLAMVDPTREHMHLFARGARTSFRLVGLAPKGEAWCRYHLSWVGLAIDFAIS